MAENLNFSSGLDKVLEEKLRSTEYTVREVIELFVNNCKDFVDHLGSGEIKSVSF